MTLVTLFCYLIQNEIQSPLPAKKMTIKSAAHRNTKILMSPSVESMINGMLDAKQKLKCAFI